MTEEVQLTLIEFERGEPELLMLPVDDDSLPPNEQMAPGELSASDFADVQMRGIINPIIVTVALEGSAWKYDMREGRRRLRAYRRLFAAGIERFGKIPALVYDQFEEEDAETWASDLNSRRSPNPISDLESIQAVVDRYEVDTNTKDGLRFLSQKTGISISTLKKRMKLFDMPAAFLRAAGETLPNTKNKKKVPIGALEVIASLNKKAQTELLEKLKAEGRLDWDDVTEAKANQTAGKVAEMQHLPGFDSLPEVDFSGVFKSEPVVDVSNETISISDINGEIVSWYAEDWTKEPEVVFAIANTLKFAYENGTDALRGLLNSNGNGHHAVDLAGD